ncbi:MAG: hypothetical protein ACYS5V_08105 [Planctomycetota bacterium]|jgi:tetratricopeptide (TPR) repeat protein
MRVIGRTFGIVAAVLTLCPTLAWAQARSRHIFKSPGLRGLRTIGGRFADESTGLGGLRLYSPGGGNLLRSSLSRGIGSYSLSRGSGGGAGGGRLGASTLTGQRYGTVGLDLRSLVGDGIDAYAGTQPPTDVLGNLDKYLVAMSETLQAAQAKGEAIKSFVPDEPSLYQSYMLKADTAFRKGQYAEASGHLRVAMALVRDGPELNLNVVLANLALGEYHSAVFHLQKALTVFPELPLLKMSLSDFYGKPEDFDRHRTGLADQLKRIHRSQEEWLLLAAYVQYFSGQEDQAVVTLRQTFRKARSRGDEATIEAASIFWDGMAAAGRVTGKLDPAGSTSSPRPAAPSPRAPSAAPGMPGPTKPGKEAPWPGGQ